MMTDEELLEELKGWDEEAWKLFKQTNYEVIEVKFNLDHSEPLHPIGKIKIGKYWFKNL